ncbi:phosphoadenosine phosphosulfate reductase [Candidatus Hakubella thermalkaliphila]|uniref:Phosphoadenosine phosphosulfate reductase n=2 Tax=Candidatus Hakubella thermalkaliphila TaxID=2754717 RepID=A0A6V8PVZ0_9ACTN|nr:phosphoadenosine phosphosulfate reductase family protein [Candidatus Hakubella thermalkaliphila]MBT9166794.1 Sulfate adenylyltransferase subunit 2 [Bacillota bacterium]GFP22601.1 phosphoadenosine phosphosulfate reductase [Candidatus Hakubella thermalkaliphila]GFP29711.1 phosphoadenosine phosphosulfate reductase [Candidatus Hakubella thermalkaliphila]GFP36487.1 phosphoadenosine phosphosulfate reductase [Candidatus Hakubella thermalkaliphila]GFP39032.1 phosphoadenosine phosphosulfate reductas
MNNKIFWCRECNVPTLQRQCENCGSEAAKICSDLKPVFEKECKFLEKEMDKRLPGNSWQNGLWMRYKTIWFNGKRLFRLSANGKPTIMKEYLCRDNLTNLDHYITAEILYKANKSTLDELEKEAVSFIREIIKSYPKREPVVSFSGGKDSTVVSHLVRKALETDKVLHIFANTTIEYPDTHNYMDRFFGNNGGIPLRENSSDQAFLEMCKLIGPPSMLNAWCCSVFKASPISRLINEVKGEEGVISFEGVRRRESSRRRNREPIYHNKKIAHQLSVYPILEWREIEVWLFILSKRLDFNDAYKKGLPRVGCMYCPYTNAFNEYLISKEYSSSYKKWIRFLEEFAKSIKKEAPSEYVSSGAWKKRVGRSEEVGEGLVYVRKVPCLKNVNAMHFILDKPISIDFIERFKPFGRIQEFSDHMGAGFIVKDVATEEELFMLKRVNDISILEKESRVNPSWKLGREFICVDILTSKNSRYLLQSIERQMRKFQACVLCGACVGICPTDAIAINPHFKISELRCSHCGRCLNTRFLRDSCVALHASQQTRRYRDGNRL